jgi:hypothetical protein
MYSGADVLTSSFHVSVDVETVVLKTPLIDNHIGGHDRVLDVLDVLDVRQHDYSRGVGLNGLDGLKLVHVADAVDNGVDLAGKGAAVLKRTLAGTQLDFPTRVVVVATRQDNVSVMLEEHTSQQSKTHEGRVDEGHVEGHSGGHEGGELAETDAVIPHVETDLALHLTQDTVGGTREVMGRLEDVRDLLRNGDGKDEQVTTPQVERLVQLLHGPTIQRRAWNRVGSRPTTARAK